jgi:hypothetical protein
MEINSFLKKIILLSLYLYLITIILSCTSKKNEKNNLINSSKVDTLMLELKNEMILKKKILGKGNKEAYNELNDYYFLNLEDKEFFYYTLVMANRYNESCAYYHLYQILEESSTPSDVKITNDSALFFLKSYFLIKSHEFGCNESKYEYKEFIKKNGVQKSLDFLLKYDKYISSPNWRKLE